jgi:hypothetical protein
MAGSGCASCERAYPDATGADPVAGARARRILEQPDYAVAFAGFEIAPASISDR